MKDKLTESVARLYRAGSEHSNQTKKLREATDNLLIWLKNNLPDQFVLPCNCKLYPSGEFICTTDGSFSGDSRVLFRITIGQKHNISQLNSFSGLIAEGFVDRISKLLEDQKSKFNITELVIDGFLKNKHS